MSNKLSRLLLTIAFPSLFSLTSFSEQIRGIVRNDEGKSVYGVIVNALKNDSITVGYAISKRDGSYILNIEDTNSKDILINFSHSQYETLVLPVSKIKENGDVSLVPGGIELNEITVLPSPIRAKGDTITYSVDALRNVSDRTLEDFISHLPGMTVDAQGNIYYNGNQINKFYIENNDMLGGRYSLATKNIRPEDVSSVNVYERHQPIKVLQDSERPENAALNIKLKKKAMLKPIGSITGGIGVRCPGLTWKGELFSMFIHPKTQTFISAKGSNFGAGYKKDNMLRYSQSPTAPSPFENIMNIFPIKGLSGIPSEYLRKLTSQSYSITSGLKVSENANLSLSVNYSKDLARWTGNKSTEYFMADQSRNVILTQESENSESEGILDASLGYELNSTNLFIEEKIFFNGTFKSDRSGIISNAYEPVEQAHRQHRFLLANSLTANIKRNNRMFSFSSKIAFSSLPVNTLMAVYPDNETNKLTQYAKSTTLDTKHNTSFSWFLGFSSFGVDLDLKTHYLSVNSLNNVDLKQDTLSKEGENNSQKGNEVTIDLGPFWQYSNETLNAKVIIPFCAKMISLSHLNQSISQSGNLNKFIPSWGLRANMGIKWSSSWRSAFAINHNENEGDITDFISEPIFTDYRSATTPGSGIFSHNKNWMGTLSTNFRDVLTGWFGNFRIMGRHATSNRTKVSDLYSSSLSDSYLNTGSKSGLLSGTLNVSKLLRQNTLGLEATGQLSSYENIRNEKLITSRLSGLNIKVNASLIFFSHLLEVYPDLSLSLKRNKIKDSFAQRYQTIDYRISCPIHVFPLKTLELKLNPYFFLNNSNLSNSSSTFLLDASLSWKYKSFQTDLTFSNITNRKAQTSVSVNPLYMNVTSVMLKGFESLLTVKYNF